MNTDKHIEKIYDWIEQTTFEHLTADQKAYVEAHFDRETYDEMHSAFTALKGAETPQPVRGKAAIREAVFGSDEIEKSTPLIIGWMHRSVNLGRAATIGLILLAGLIWSLSRETVSQISSSEELVHDTVFVTQNRVVPQIVKHTDTVFQEVVRTVYVTQKNNSATPAETNVGRFPQPGIHIVSTSDLNSVSNRKKKNSLKHDSLAREFDYVAM